MQNDFSFCPNCGGKEIENVRMRKWHCPECGLTLYNNVAAAVGLIIRLADGRVLFEKRAKEPRKGFLALPGGFVDPDESAEEACVRECREEIGVEPKKIRYVASFPNSYEYKGILYKTCDLFFEAELPEGAELKAQEGEVLAFEPMYAGNEDEISRIPLAFESARFALMENIGKGRKQ